MKLTLQIQLLPTAEQAALLVATMERFNAAATLAARLGFEAGVFAQPSVHKLAYRRIRDEFGLSAQMAVRAIGKAVEVFKRDKTVCPSFRPHGAVTYDERILGFKGVDKVSLWCLGGRQVVGMAYGEYQGERFDRIKGQCDLVLREGRFYLFATVDLPEAPMAAVGDFLGVDLGVVNVAVDSDGNAHTGKDVEAVRRKHTLQRQRLQRKGTKGAKKKLRRVAGKEGRFRRHHNHVIAKKIVRLAKGTGRGIALENLKGIRGRLTVRGGEARARLSGWAFAQLRAFVEYKARLAGVPVVSVDPAYTSQTCAGCGHCCRANRKSQDKFLCVSCGRQAPADRNAALNVKFKAQGACKTPLGLAALAG
jgi:putative transposase